MSYFAPVPTYRSGRKATGQETPSTPGTMNMLNIPMPPVPIRKPVVATTTFPRTPAPFTGSVFQLESSLVSRTPLVNPYAALVSRQPTRTTPSVPPGSGKKSNEKVGVNPIRSALRVQTKTKLPDLIVKPIYLNTLPDLSYGPKSVMPFQMYNIQRYSNYSTSSFEKNYQYEMQVGNDMDLNIDLVIPPSCNAWFAPPGSVNLTEEQRVAFMDPKDLKLLDGDDSTSKGVGGPFRLSSNKIQTSRSSTHTRVLPCFRRTEYVAADDDSKFLPNIKPDRIESKIGYCLERKNLLYWSYDKQIKAIEKTFTAARKPIKKHFSNPNLVPVEVLPVFPDFDQCKHAFALVNFDSDPAPLGKQPSDDVFSKAIVRGVRDENGDEFVAYFLPTDEAAVRIKEEAGDDNCTGTSNKAYEYALSREYNFKIKNNRPKSGDIETCFFIMKDGGVFYNELDTKVVLTKRKGTGLPSCSNVLVSIVGESCFT